jgi:hypothetical protein
MSGLRLAAVAASATLLAGTAATTAMATPVHVAFKGLASGTILLNDFRTIAFSNAPMAGYFTYDPTIGIDASGAGFTRREGGVVLGPPLTGDPVSEAGMLVKGVLNGLYYTFISDDFFGFAENDYAIGQAVYQADTNSELDSYLHFSLSSPDVTPDLEAPFQATVGTGVFNNEWLLAGPFLRSSGSFVITEARVGPNVGFASVPEPASWALMILGFGAAGGAIRRRLATPA